MPRVKLEIDKDICARLVIVMDLLDIGQGEMSKILNVSQPFVSRIRRGEAEMSAGMIKALFFQKNVSPMFMIANQLPILYDKQPMRTIENEVMDMRIELEMLKARFLIIKEKLT